MLHIHTYSYLHFYEYDNLLRICLIFISFILYCKLIISHFKVYVHAIFINFRIIIIIFNKNNFDLFVIKLLFHIEMYY